MVGAGEAAGEVSLVPPVLRDWDGDAAGAVEMGLLFLEEEEGLGALAAVEEEEEVGECAAAPERETDGAVAGDWDQAAVMAAARRSRWRRR